MVESIMLDLSSKMQLHIIRYDNQDLNDNAAVATFFFLEVVIKEI
jgi:hypothetical protein